SSLLSIFFSFFLFFDSSLSYIYTLSLHDALPILLTYFLFLLYYFLLLLLLYLTYFLLPFKLFTIDIFLYSFYLFYLTHNYIIFRSEEHTSELQSRFDLVCRLLLEKKNIYIYLLFI